MSPCFQAERYNCFDSSFDFDRVAGTADKKAAGIVGVVGTAAVADIVAAADTAAEAAHTEAAARTDLAVDCCYCCNRCSLLFSRSAKA